MQRPSESLVLRWLSRRWSSGGYSHLTVTGAVAGAVIGGVAEVAAGAAAGSVVGIAADDRIHSRGAQVQDEIFSHKGGGDSLLEAPGRRYTAEVKRSA